ncbi:MAG: hypothetical protein R3C32_10875 [Chloroflexota bacterium]
MTAIAAELLADIDKDTVAFVENYDGTRMQPSVLPAAAQPPHQRVGGYRSVRRPTSRPITWGRSSRPPTRSSTTPA